MKALFIVGINQYGVVDHFVEGMRKDLHSMGWQTSLINLSDSTKLNLEEDSLTCDLVISCNGLGIDLVVEGNAKLIDVINKPLFVFLVDHPMHVLHRLLGVNCTLLCVDQSHVQFAQFCGLKAIYFPHALAAEEYNEHDFLDYQLKLKQLFLPCSYQDKEQAKKMLTPLWSQLEPILSHSSNTQLFLMNLGVLPYQDKPARLNIDNNVLAVMTNADLYLRAVSREQFIAQTAQAFAEYPLVMNGRNVENYQQFNPMVSAQSNATVAQVKQTMLQSLFVLHSVPGFTTAIHERILFAIASGTAVICDEPETVSRADNSLTMLTLAQAKQLDEKQYLEIRDNNIDIARQKHSWKNRFTTVFEQTGL